MNVLKVSAGSPCTTSYLVGSHQLGKYFQNKPECVLMEMGIAMLSFPGPKPLSVNCNNYTKKCENKGYLLEKIFNCASLTQISVISKNIFCVSSDF